MNVCSTVRWESSRLPSSTSGQHPARLRGAPTAARPLAKTRTAGSLTTRTRLALCTRTITSTFDSCSRLHLRAAAATFAATFSTTAARQGLRRECVFKRATSSCPAVHPRCMGARHMKPISAAPCLGSHRRRHRTTDAPRIPAGARAPATTATRATQASA